MFPMLSCGSIATRGRNKEASDMNVYRMMGLLNQSTLTCRVLSARNAVLMSQVEIDLLWILGSGSLDIEMLRLGV